MAEKNGSTYPFELKPLAYSYTALEPYIDAKTVEIHHDKHLQTYTNNLNNALAEAPKLQNYTLEELLTAILPVSKELRTKILNNAGGVYNHNLYFDTLGPATENRKPQGILADAIIEAFGSYDAMVTALSGAAVGQFGSGWGFLVTDANGRLSVVALPNQDTVLAQKLTPLLPLDVWEHAYYLKYQNLRGDYCKNYFNVINWEKVEEIYANAVKHKGSLFGSKQV